MAVRVEVLDRYTVAAGNWAERDRHQAIRILAIVIRKPTRKTETSVVVWTIRYVRYNSSAEAYAIGGGDQRLCISTKHVQRRLHSGFGNVEGLHLGCRT